MSHFFLNDFQEFLLFLEYFTDTVAMKFKGLPSSPPFLILLQNFFIKHFD
ncbi:hypothetical protein [Campylobacter sp. US33a]|nr:hypothetical protein [Campylobacter sp. US33a]MCW1359968.1 hypothetical protein [Campylobacter jejuni]